MDTRAKIVSENEAAVQAVGRQTVLLLSSFDVLTATRIRRVRDLLKTGALLVAVITDSADTLLPTQARAELAASLAIIDLVIVGKEPVAALLGRFPGATVIDDHDADTRRTTELINYVHQRNRNAAE
jgi:hypothetical protein